MWYSYFPGTENRIQAIGILKWSAKPFHFIPCDTHIVQPAYKQLVNKKTPSIAGQHFPESFGIASLELQILSTA